MENDTVRRIEAQGPGSILEEIARRGAQQMLAEAMEAEVAEFLAQHAEKRDENGHRVVVRNGHMPRARVDQRDRTDPDRAAADR